MAFFKSKKEIKLFLCEKSVGQNKPFVLDKSEPDRLCFKCPEDGCSFKMIFHSDFDGVFRLDEELEHDCQALLPTIKRAWIRKKIEEMKREDRNIKPKATRRVSKKKNSIDVGKVLIANALSDVKKELYQDDQSFGLTASFLDAVTASNEGTTVRLMSEGNVFQRAFLCPGVCKNAFMHTVKISGLDACHIKAPYGGALLVMTALDGNGQIFPVALGIAESENASTWTWFIDLVKTALDIQDGGEGLVFLSDREKGIDSSLDEVLPQATHGYCVFHIQKNVKKQFHTTLDGLLFKAARAATVKAFKDVMEEIKAIHPAARAYIKGVDRNKWARAFFKARRLGHVTSNIAESANWWLEEARSGPSRSLFDIHLDSQRAVRRSAQRVRCDETEHSAKESVRPARRVCQKGRESQSSPAQRRVLRRREAQQTSCFPRCGPGGKNLLVRFLRGVRRTLPAYVRGHPLCPRRSEAVRCPRTAT